MLITTCFTLDVSINSANVDIASFDSGATRKSDSQELFVYRKWTLILHVVK
jgi:hypothetical protein